MIGRTNAKRGGSGNVTTVTISSGASGETVTATRTGKSKTAVTDSNGVATFKNLDMGYDWTFTWSTFSKTEKIDQLSESVTLGAVSVDIYKETNYAGGTYVIYEFENGTVGEQLISWSSSGSTYTKVGTIEMTPGRTYLLATNSNKLIVLDIHQNTSNGTLISKTRIYPSLTPSYGHNYSFTLPTDTTALYVYASD